MLSFQIKFVQTAKQMNGWTTVHQYAPASKDWRHIVKYCKINWVWLLTGNVISFLKAGKNIGYIYLNQKAKLSPPLMLKQVLKMSSIIISIATPKRKRIQLP